MYTFICPDIVNNRLIQFSKKSPSILSSLEELTNNPYARAKETKIPAIGSYYVNSGRLCILFEIEEVNKKIIILTVVYDSYLHKLLTGRIYPDTTKLI